MIKKVAQGTSKLKLTMTSIYHAMLTDITSIDTVKSFDDWTCAGKEETGELQYKITLLNEHTMSQSRASSWNVSSSLYASEALIF